MKIGEGYLSVSIHEGMISIPMENDLSIEGGKALTVSSDWRPGDLICRIDGQPIGADYPTSALAKWSVGAPGTVVRLSLCDGSTRMLTLARFY